MGVRFSAVIEALAKGCKVRRSTWEKTTWMFVLAGCLMCQRTIDSEPYPYSLDWHEIGEAADWIVTFEV